MQMAVWAFIFCLVLRLLWKGCRAASYSEQPQVYRPVTHCFLCDGGENPSTVCPACLQVNLLPNDLITFTLQVAEEEMCMTVRQWGSSNTFFPGSEE